jgi:predicted 3-demethylubiquinone-9 3-methyltransferase (glyoxalase superfamily)
MATMQKITPHLWFDNQAEEAVNFYTSVFKNSSTIRTSHYGKAGFEVHKMPEGTVMTIEFEIEGERFVALNGGPVFKFNEAVSFIVKCENQEELDYYWEKLSEGGDKNAQQCGWLKDRFGVSWQVIPTELSDMMSDENTERKERVISTFMKMKKLDMKELEKAYEGDTAEVVAQV